LIGCGVLGVVALLACAGLGVAVWKSLSPTEFPEETQPYAEARKTFQTKLVRQGPAPQGWVDEVPPATADVIDYPSGTLQLKAWVDKPVEGAAPKPAVLFLHGGFAFGDGDWDQPQPFRDAGFVVMTPMLRGENGLPGSYSLFYDEVNDVLAAADTLAALPYVDPKRIYVCGHSAGGTLALLAAMASDRFRAAAGFSGSPDQVLSSRGQPELVVFERNDREFQMRSPLAFPRSFQCPVRIYYGSDEFLFDAPSQKTAKLAQAAGRDVQAVKIPGDHFTSVEPAMRQCVPFFLQH
jgi:dipeptidyl aminopeptidase/acylaminoacyl peptidase